MSSEDARQSAGPRAEGRLPHAGEWRHLLSLVYLRRDSTAPVQPMWRRDLLSADECRKEEGGGGAGFAGGREICGRNGIARETGRDTKPDCAGSNLHRLLDACCLQTRVISPTRYCGN
jgi:hypothetical protein